MVHAAHLEYQQPRVVDALIRSLEAKGSLPPVSPMVVPEEAPRRRNRSTHSSPTS